MKIAIKELLQSHYKDTGEYITQKMLAEEMVKEGIFKNIHSAQNMIQYNITGKAKSADYAMVEFLCKHFGVKINDIIR